MELKTGGKNRPNVDPKQEGCESIRTHTWVVEKRHVAHPSYKLNTVMEDLLFMIIMTRSCLEIQTVKNIKNCALSTHNT